MSTNRTFFQSHTIIGITSVSWLHPWDDNAVPYLKDKNTNRGCLHMHAKKQKCSCKYTQTYIQTTCAAFLVPPLHLVPTDCLSIFLLPTCMSFHQYTFFHFPLFPSILSFVSSSLPLTLSVNAVCHIIFLLSPSLLQ